MNLATCFQSPRGWTGSSGEPTGWNNAPLLGEKSQVFNFGIQVKNATFFAFITSKSRSNGFQYEPRSPSATVVSLGDRGCPGPQPGLSKC
jgi:hypothetical protein